MHPRTPTPHPAADLDSLYRNYRGYVLARAHAATQDATLAEDIASEVWANLAAHPRPMRDTDRLHRFFATLVRNAAATHYRRASAHERPADTGAPVWHTAVAPSAEDTALAQDTPDLHPHWRGALAVLTPRQRSALLLHCEGMSNSAIAAREGYSPAAAACHIRAAVTNLRVVLAASTGKAA